MSIDVSGLTKDFGSFRAVDNVSFGLRKGQIVGLLGANGAGKTTLVHMILGLIVPPAGDIRIFGLDPRRRREDVLGRLNFISPYVGFPARMTVFENLVVYARLYGVASRAAVIADLLGRFGIEDLRDKQMAGLSSGETTRVGLCKVFLNEPDLLILDEPLANLDPHAAAHVRQMLIGEQLRRNITVLHTSHNMAHVESLCDRVILLDHGRIIADGTPIDVTRAMLQADRSEPALSEIFMTLGGRGHAAS